jgi:hypothetical protein
VIAKYPDAKVKIFVLWGPYLELDNREQAMRASAYMPGRRVINFWDVWKFGTRAYSEQLGLTHYDAWDLFAVYEPGAVWTDTPPPMLTWFQNRNLDKGERYTMEDMEDTLRPWLK